MGKNPGKECSTFYLLVSGVLLRHLCFTDDTCQPILVRPQHFLQVARSHVWWRTLSIILNSVLCLLGFFCLISLPLPIVLLLLSIQGVAGFPLSPLPHLTDEVPEGIHGRLGGFSSALGGVSDTPVS